MSNPPDQDSDPRASTPLWRHINAFAEILQQKRPRRTRDARINWGRGRLAAFSSQSSFIAQFCALNDLKLVALEHFLADYFELDNGWWRVFSDEHISRLAHLLDEPRATVNTLSDDSFTLPACFGDFACQFGEVKHDKYVSYCPVCLSRGYHSSFHEAPWLYRCLLHREPLKRIPVDGGPTAYVSVVAELLRSACARWPDVWGENTFPGEAAPHFAQFRRWLELARNRAARQRSQNVASLGEMPYSFNNIGTLLGRLNTLAPIPAELIDLLIVAPERQLQNRVEVPRDAVDMIKVTNKKFPLWYLLWFFNKYVAIVSNRRCLSTLLAEQEIRRLEQEHTVCRCQWSWDRYAGWRPISLDEERPSWLLCPYKYAIKELKERWLVFALSDASNQSVNKIESQFVEGCKLVLDNELGYVPSPPISLPKHRGLLASFLLPELTLGNDVESVLDLLLAGQVTTHCEELAAWLSSITTDREPIRAPPVGGTNLFLSNGAAWISSWKRLEARSGNAVARWEEGCQFRP